MSITDELRKVAAKTECANGRCEKLYRGDLEHIADRIDAEHQKALDEWKAKHGQMWLKGYAECHAELLEGNETLASDLESCGWIRLPKDADGVTWRIGDRDEDGGTVTAIKLGLDGFWIRVGCTYKRAEETRHYQPDTWEKIIEDAIVSGKISSGYLEVRYTAAYKNLVKRCKELAGDAE